MIVRLAAAFSFCLAATQTSSTVAEKFENYNHTFQLELPEGWRQIAPNEAVALKDQPDAAPGLYPTQPRLMYTVGPIDDWLNGDLSGAWLRVIERKDTWYIGDNFESFIREHWRQASGNTDVAHQIDDVSLVKIGTQQVECITAIRTSTPPPQRPATRSLDIHIGTANQQLTLSFGAALADFDKWQPKFHDWLESLVLARVAEAPQTLSDRLWTPLLVGGAVGLVLLLLYKHTRARR